MAQHDACPPKTLQGTLGGHFETGFFSRVGELLRPSVSRGDDRAELAAAGRAFLGSALSQKIECRRSTSPTPSSPQ